MKALLLSAGVLVLGACTPDPAVPPAEVARKTSPAPVSPAGPREATTVPAAFVGEWNIDPADCGTSRNDSRLRIEPTRIAWWESSGAVTRVTVHADNDIEVRARLTGEGESWDSNTRFALQGQDTLVATDATGGTVTRKRCPAP